MNISIIGGGPAGSIAAASSAEEKYNVTVYEEHKKVGFPEYCGGLLSKKAIDWFQDLGVNCRKSIVNKIIRAKIVCNGREFEVGGNKTKAYVVKRSTFDQVCSDFAKKKGAEYKLGKRLKENEIKRLSKNSIIIGADGSFSTVANTFDFPNIKCAVAYQANVKITNLERGSVVIFLFKSSFGWIIPTGDNAARVGIMLFDDIKKSKFDNLLKKVDEKFRVKKKSKPFAASIPITVRKKIQKENIYLVGDAAGQVKATSGGGVFYGCKSAWLAGKCIETKDYEKKWKKELGKKLKSHKIVRDVVNLFDENIFALGIAVMKSLNIQSRLYNYDMEELSSILR